ncbi:Plus3 domain-containing protein [Abeliophyllum distichum]|uniref:Plus3 domain-containing protein n=1 Tax=Abeliophyllum distichum TaxID=126358 RepID=A0ABD1Q3Q2_9LAMI
MSYEVESESEQEAMSWERGRNEGLGHNIGWEREVESGYRTALIWKCKFFPSEISQKQFGDWHRIYRILDNVEFIVPGLDDLAEDLPLGCMAAMLATGLHLLFPRIIRTFLREWRIAPTQIYPNGWRIMIGFLILWDQLCFSRPSVREFNSLYSFKSNEKRSGWWYASMKARTRGSVVTRTPNFFKNWKKFWFFVRDSWKFSENEGYSSYDPTEESSERARRARTLSEHFRSCSTLIIEENLISARLSPTSLDRAQPRQSGEEMKDIYVLLNKKNQARKGKRKALAEDHDQSSRSHSPSEIVLYVFRA